MAVHDIKMNTVGTCFAYFFYSFSENGKLRREEMVK